MAKAKIVVIMPAYNAAKTLKKTYSDIPKNLASEVILVDDASADKTVSIAKKLGLSRGKGYKCGRKKVFNW